jgi:hypothetical protein
VGNDGEELVFFGVGLLELLVDVTIRSGVPSGAHSMTRPAQMTQMVEPFL